MTTPIHGIPDWAAEQASPWTTENQSKRMLEAMARRGIVEDRDLATPPVSCDDGACYLVDVSATGAWAGQDGRLAIAVGVNAASGWYFITVAVEGTTLYVRDEDREIVYNGSAWVISPQASAIAYTPADEGNYAASVEQALDELYVLVESGGGGGGGGGGGLWELVQTEDLSSAASIDLEDFAGDNSIALLMILVDVVMSVDGSSLVMQTKQNGSYKTSGDYHYNLSQRSSSGSTNSFDSQAATATRPTGFGGTWGIGSAAGEAVSLLIEFPLPMRATNPLAHTIRGYHSAPSGARVYCDGAGIYDGTDFDNVLQGVRLKADNDEGANVMTGRVRVFALKTA